MIRWMLPTVAAALLSLPALAADAPAGPGDLAARIAELETQVKELKALLIADLGAKAAKDLDQERRAKERAEALKRLEILVAAVIKADAKAAGSKELADMLTFSSSPESEVRRCLARSLDRLPAKLAGPVLVGMVRDENGEVAIEALKSLVVLGEGGGRDAAADRLAALNVSEFRSPGAAAAYYGATSDISGGMALLIATGDYLTRFNDSRGVVVGMQHLRRFVAREEAEPKSSPNPYGPRTMNLSTYDHRNLIESLSRWSGAGVEVGKADPRMGGYPTPEQNLAAAKRLLEWWERNKDGFKLPAPQAQAKPEGGRPEQF